MRASYFLFLAPLTFSLGVCVQFSLKSNPFTSLLALLLTALCSPLKHPYCGARPAP